MRVAASTTHAVRAFAPATALAALILVAAVVPLPEVEPAPERSGLAVHAVLYALLCATLVRGWRLQRVPRTYSGPFVATVVYGIIHELVQLLVPYRHASISDVVADAVGALAALALIALIDRRRTRPLWAPAAYR